MGCETNTTCEEREDPGSDEPLRILEELRIHQAELEVQNTELRSAHLRLEESRRRYRELFDLAPVGYLSLDERGKTLEANRAAELILEARMPLIGRHLTSFFSEDEADKLHLHIAAAKEGRRRETCTLRLGPTAGKGLRHIQIDSIAAGEPGQAQRVQTCLVDITPQIEAQRQVRELNIELEKRVELRTQELTSANAQLRYQTEERRKAERLLATSRKLEAVGRLAGGLAHDLNNVMTVISMNASSLQEKMAAEDPLRELVDEVAAAAEQAVALPRQLLVFSRGQPSDDTPVDVGVTLEALGAMLRRLLGDARMTLDVQREDATWVKLGRSPQEQIVVNLVLNARDAMPDGGRVLLRCAHRRLKREELSKLPGARPIPYVVIQVVDTGIGMDAETRERMFEPFFTTKAQGEGTGLGLATVYRLVTTAGGFVHVDSGPRGTSVEVYLPRVDRPAPGAPVSSFSPGSRELSRFEGARVLLVDDEGSIVRLLSRLLDKAGYDVRVATSGAEALRIVESSREHREPLDLLVTDVAMPEMSGPQLVEALESDGIVLPTLFISGYVVEELSPRAEFLQKPFKPVEFLAAIARILESNAVGAASRVDMKSGERSTREAIHEASTS